MSSTKHLVQTSPHYEVLDGLRGIAAIAVVIFHFMEIAVPDYNNSFIAHAYLSVDFFFCLSGFVIAHAYDQRMSQMGAWSFFKLRLIRLHPMVIFASITGLAIFILDPFSDLWTKYADRLGVMFAASCFMIPYPMVKERYFNLFHINPPTWSLFWEYIANIFYALILVKLRNKILWIVAAAGALLLYYEAFRSGYLGVGWGGDNFWGGGIRVLFSFVAGMLVYRSGWIFTSRLGLIATGMLLMLVFVLPFSKDYNKFIDPTLVVFYLPLVLMLGAGAVAAGWQRKVSRFLGDISYPLYMIHYPFIWLFMSYVEKMKPSLPVMLSITAAGTALLTALAWLVFIAVDVPVRTWLRKRFVLRQPVNTTT